MAQYKTHYLYRSPWQASLYNLSRKFYLLGRDPLLNALALKEERLCEIGCGTGRNLIRMAKRYPEATFYGVDVSSALLHYAQKKINRANLDKRVTLIEEDASEVATKTLFLNSQCQFDRILFSYVLSICTDYKSILEKACANVKSGGYIHIIDFSDTQGLARIPRFLFNTWLSWFGVYHKPEVVAYLQDQVNTKGGACHIHYSPMHYYEIITFQKGE